MLIKILITKQKYAHRGATKVPNPSIIICKKVVGEVVGNCFRAQKHVQWQITNRQKLLALSSLDKGFN